MKLKGFTHVPSSNCVVFFLEGVAKTSERMKIWKWLPSLNNFHVPKLPQVRQGFTNLCFDLVFDLLVLRRFNEKMSCAIKQFPYHERKISVISNKVAKEVFDRGGCPMIGSAFFEASTPLESHVFVFIENITIHWSHYELWSTYSGRGTDRLKTLIANCFTMSLSSINVFTTEYEGFS